MVPKNLLDLAQDVPSLKGILSSTVESSSNPEN